MGDKTLIDWADSSWPVTSGCTRVSPGCANCYAIRDSWRLGHNPNPKVRACYEGTVEKGERLDWTGTVRTLPERLDWPLKWRRPRRIFVANMGDLFHESVPGRFVNEVWTVMRQADRHTYQLLTKRPERLLEWTQRKANATGWPVDEIWPAWCWLGVTAENQEMADRRIPLLLQVPAAVRFVSCEPMLGEMWLGLYMPNPRGKRMLTVGGMEYVNRLDWVIAGGESGPNARPSHPDWFRGLRDQCAQAGVAYYFKQWGEWAPDCGYEVLGYRFLDGTWTYRVGRRAAGRMLDGREHREFPEVQRDG